ncbi:hypothetical protein C8Q80DRAFT_1107082 [Daedaleopsis nitida]|nr:hypothetical protein C8Q80DRAFT_1107082 [Daedaleopsis nitida]
MQLPDESPTQLDPEAGDASLGPSSTSADVHVEHIARQTPATDHTSLPHELWLEIFRCATRVPRSRSIAPGDPLAPERPVDYARRMNSPIESMRTKCVLVRVCRAWRIIATELLYEHVVLGGPHRVETFCRTLRESRKEASKAVGGALESAEGLGHGRWVKHLEVQRWARSHLTLCYWQSIIRTVSYCPRMRVFSGLWQQPLPDGFLPVLAQYLPPTLQELYWQQDSVLVAVNELPILTTMILTNFPTLRVLDLRKICVLDAERSMQHFPFGTITFPHVQYLALPACPLMLRYASQQVLPALCYLALDASGAPRTVYPPLATKELLNFLDRHGEHLRTVELLPSNTLSQRPGPINISVFLIPNACPNLETLIFDCREKPPPTVLDLYHYNATSSLPLLEEPHPTLRRIGIRGLDIGRLYPNKPTQAQAHLDALVQYRVFFPALELVRTPGFLIGTSTDMYAPEVFVWWTEKFEAAGVDLQDGEGVVWLLEEEQGPKMHKANTGPGPGGDEKEKETKTDGEGGGVSEAKAVAGPSVAVVC